jgi:hypothetical protein
LEDKEDSLSLNLLSVVLKEEVFLGSFAELLGQS